MSDAEKYYHSLLTFGIRPGLDRISLLLKKLGDPQKSLKFVHVAGTNGKGTTCSFIAEILKKAGYKTGLYTSPYIVDFRERVRINGEMISCEHLEKVTETVKKYIDELANEDVVITEFEAVTAAAFLYFKTENCDIVVLETGLGGRFDATNVIETPLASVITSISLDHINILGETQAEIAFEKCGIIKNGCPVVTVSSQVDDVIGVIKSSAENKNAALSVADVRSVEILSESAFGSEVKHNGIEVFVPFPGRHQIENCILALECIDILKRNGIKIPDNAIIAGIRDTKNPARCEIVSKKPTVILDGCHNEGSAKALDAVLTEFYSGKKIKAVMGMMADKAVDKVINILLPHFESVITVTPSNPRAMSAKELNEKITAYGTPSYCISAPEEGVKKALSDLDGDEVLLVCGSLYLCADVRRFFMTSDN